MQQCGGSLLIFCDADDIFAKHCFISLYNVLRNAPRPDSTPAGSRFERTPAGSISRYIQWANLFKSKQICNQVLLNP
uniref:Glycosyltransferase 2-like domain-containing protein n=1 Tax=Loa loa TaxID=7209 RepID=A0A1I7VE03_LOALO